MKIILLVLGTLTFSNQAFSAILDFPFKVGDAWEYASTFHRYMPYLPSLDYPYAFTGTSIFKILEITNTSDTSYRVVVDVKNASATKWNPDTLFNDTFSFDWTRSTTKNYEAKNYPYYRAKDYYFQFLNTCSGIDTCNIENPTSYHSTHSKYSTAFGTVEMSQQSYVRTTLTIIDRYKLISFNGTLFNSSLSLKKGSNLISKTNNHIRRFNLHHLKISYLNRNIIGRR